MIDTHTHIYLDRFKDDIDDVLERAKAAGLERFYLPNIDKDSIQDLKDLAANHANIYPMMGLHPSHVKEDWQEQLAQVWEELAGETKYCAVGEIGMDLYWDKTFIAEQKLAFTQQIRKAKEMGLAIVIHSRDAFDETFEVLEAEADDKLFGIFHCFTGTLEQAKRALALNLKLGIGGVVTFKNGGLDKVVAELKTEDLVLETDAPFLAPAPFRGKRNEPAYLAQIAQRIADLHEISKEDVASITSANALKIFGHE